MILTTCILCWRSASYRTMRLWGFRKSIRGLLRQLSKCVLIIVRICTCTTYISGRWMLTLLGSSLLSQRICCSFVRTSGAWRASYPSLYQTLLANCFESSWSYLSSTRSNCCTDFLSFRHHFFWYIEHSSLSQYVVWRRTFLSKSRNRLLWMQRHIWHALNFLTET